MAKHTGNTQPMTALPFRTRRGLKPLLLAVALSAGLHSGATLAQAAPAPQTIDIPAGSLAQALDRLGEQTGVLIIYEPGLVQGINAPGVSGQLPPAEALRRLLGTSGIQVEAVNDRTFVLKRDTPSATPRPGIRSAPATTRSPEPEVQELGAVTVTGTRIRGGVTPSPVIGISALQIQEEGFTDLGEVIRSIPQNFSGGQNPGVLMGNVTGSGMTNQNVTGGSALNLRGLGPDASLTLLNGRRLAYGGFVQSVDIGAIPVDAVERVEIVADGASAIYGSDAVGGVANVILKRDYEGVRIGTRFGTATDGGLTTREYNATVGTTWSTGGVIATYKHESVDPIYARERAYTDQLPEPATIYPDTGLGSGLVSAYQSLGDAAELRWDVLRTKRDQRYHYYYGDTAWYNDLATDTTTFLASPSIEFFLPNDWTLTLGGAWGEDETKVNHSTVVAASGVPTPYMYDCYCNKSRSYEASVEGPVFELPGGDARIALGIGYRENEYAYTDYLGSGASYEGDESVRFAYAEANVPLIGPELGIAGVQRLTLTAAVRGEDYDSFGSVTTPKFGLIYSPTADFTFKGSWGKSFKAPTLFQRHYPQRALLVPPSAYGAAGYPADAALLDVLGGNPDLSPERARTWIASLVFHPEAIPGLEAELTYFDIDYSHRVVEPITSADGILSNPAYAEFIDTSPSPQRLADILAMVGGAFYNFTGAPYDPNMVVAIVDSRYVNTLRERVSGVDLSAAYRFPWQGGELALRGALNWLDSRRETVGSPVVHDLSGTLHNPAKIKGRVGTTWNKSGFNAALFANYTGGVKNVLDGRDGASFTTFDTVLSYSLGGYGNSLSGVQVSFVVNNLLDRQPPLYVPDVPDYVAAYDSTNYSAIGRFMSLLLSKQF